MTINLDFKSKAIFFQGIPYIIYIRVPSKTSLSVRAFLVNGWLREFYFSYFSSR